MNVIETGQLDDGLSSASFETERGLKTHCSFGPLGKRIQVDLPREFNP